MSITRSIMRPIMRPIARGIADGIAAAKRYYWLFGGDYASLQAPDSPVTAAVSPADYSWSPTGTEFNVKLKVDLAAVDMGVQRFMLSDITTSLPRLYKTGSDKLRLQYDSDGVGTIEQITSSSAYSAGDELDIEIQFRSTGTEIFINGDSEGNSSTPAFSPSTLFTLALMGANQSASSRWNGRIWDVLFEDLGDSSNSRSYAIDEGEGTIIKNSLDAGPFSQSRGELPKGNNLDLDMSVSAALSVGDIYRFSYLHVATSTSDQIVEAGGRFMQADNTNQLIFTDANLSVTVDGAAVSSGFALTDGQKYAVEATVDAGSGDISALLSNGAGANYSASVLGDFQIERSGGVEVRWLMSDVIDLGNGQAYVPSTGSAGDVEPTEYVTNGDFDTDLSGWTFGGADTSWNNGTAYAGDGETFELRQNLNGTKENDLYLLKINILSKGTVNITVQFNFITYATFSTTGVKEVRFVAPVDNFNMKITTNASINGVRQVDSISVEKLNGALVNNYDASTDTQLVAAQTDFIANTDPNWVEV